MTPKPGLLSLAPVDGGAGVIQRLLAMLLAIVSLRAVAVRLGADDSVRTGAVEEPKKAKLQNARSRRAPSSSMPKWSWSETATEAANTPKMLIDDQSMSKPIHISLTPVGASHLAMLAMAVAALVLPIRTYGGVVRPLTTDTGWRYYNGTATPTNNWTTKEFDDSRWAATRMPFGRGDQAAGTVLNDTGTNRSTFYLRYNLTNWDAIAITSLELSVESGGAFIVWINGVEAWKSAGVPAAPLRETRTLTNPTNFFERSSPGRQTIAVQVFNPAGDSPEVHINLRATAHHMFAADAIKVACVGSSTTQGHNTYLGSYPMLLQALLGPGYEVRNYGHNGTRLIRQLVDKSRPLNVSYTDNPVIGPEWYDSVAWEPDIICIQLGVNDASTNCDWREKQQHFESEYDYLIAPYTNRPGPAPRICIEPPSWVATNNNPHPVNGWAFTDDGTVANGEVVPRARRYAASRGYQLIDVYAATFGRWPEYYLANGADPLHLSPLGNHVIARLVADEIKRPAAQAGPGSRKDTQDAK